MILFDTSALRKLLKEEQESQALEEFVESRRQEGKQLIVSVIATIELRRLAIRQGLDLVNVQQLLRVFTEVDMNSAVIGVAGWIPNKYLRTLDAIHIATAIAARCTSIVTYDERQVEAAAEVGIPAITPR